MEVLHGVLVAIIIVLGGLLWNANKKLAAAHINVAIKKDIPKVVDNVCIEVVRDRTLRSTEQTSYMNAYTLAHPLPYTKFRRVSGSMICSSERMGLLFDYAL